VYRIVAKEQLTPVTKMYVIEAPDVARKAQAGNSSSCASTKKASECR
jgi:hypothetical protein